MSSLLNKAKDAMGKSGGSSGSTGGSGAGQQSGIEKGVSGQAHTRKSLHALLLPSLVLSITHQLATSLTSFPLLRNRQPHRQGRHGRQVRRQDQQARRRPDQQPGPRRCWQQVNDNGRKDNEMGRIGLRCGELTELCGYDTVPDYLPAC
jgi:hypothetical protein